LKNAWLAVVSGALILASCSSASSSPKPDVDADRAAVRSAVEAYLKGMLPPGDVAGMLSPFADSAHYLAAGEPTFKGREPIRSFFQSYVDAFTLGPTTYTIHDVRVSGDLAVAVVAATEEFTDKKTGVTYREDFKGLSVLTRQPGGSWHIIYHTYNSDHPTPPTVSAR
jgi:uncharacterized protein (TIGR02246 family)